MLEEKHRIDTSPMRFAGGFARASSYSEDEIETRLRELGLPLPPLDADNPKYDWDDDQWWGRVEELAGDWRKEQLWAVFNRCRQFEVVEAEAEI